MGKIIKITPPEGYEVDKEKSTFEEIVFKKLEPNFPMSWEELGVIKGCYISSRSYIGDIFKTNAVDGNQNLFPTRKEAEAMLAMAQLCQLRDRWNDGWKADWENVDESKYCISSFKYELEKIDLIGSYRPMFFKTKKLRDDFMVVFKDLLETAKPFL